RGGSPFRCHASRDCSSASGISWDLVSVPSLRGIRPLGTSVAGMTIVGEQPDPDPTEERPVTHARDIIKSDACTVVELLRRGEVTPHDLLDVLERQIAEVDPKVNALPTLAWERARAHADRLMGLAPTERGPLAGLPLPIKDTVEVAGVR